MNWIGKANSVKDYIIFYGYKIFPFYKRCEIIKSYYACKTVEDYKLFTLTYNRAILKELL